MTLLITPADKWFSLCVRERSNWTCERCGKQYHEGDQGLHCSHFIGRGNWSVRLEPLNAFAHCFGCHMHFEGNPHEFVAWAQDKLKSYYEIVLEMAKDIMRGKEYKRTKGKGEVAAHYKAEFEKMKSIRAQGETGRIEFTGWL